jgi:hypothetical protein
VIKYFVLISYFCYAKKKKDFMMKKLLLPMLLCTLNLSALHFGPGPGDKPLSVEEQVDDDEHETEDDSYTKH